ncbi:MAG: retroviral-like aspartic protease family protein [Fibrobacteres bacterium]|nr:retroviral-like aspartic protease family protein [Fibrobacterota bacterium]
MKVNIPISGYTYTFLFDTGADRVFINKKVLRRLTKENNVMSDSAITGKFEIATGEIVILPLVRIKEIKLGDVVLKDIAAAVQDDSTTNMLFGMSAIGKFKSWTMHESPLQIIFHKQ